MKMGIFNFLSTVDNQVDKSISSNCAEGEPCASKGARTVQEGVAVTPPPTGASIDFHLFPTILKKAKNLNSFFQIRDYFGLALDVFIS